MNPGSYCNDRVGEGGAVEGFFKCREEWRRREPVDGSPSVL